MTRILFAAFLFVGCTCPGPRPDSAPPEPIAPPVTAEEGEAQAPVPPSSPPVVPSADAEVAPNNVILLIGDGMGPVHERAASLFRHGTGDGLTMQQAPVRTQITTHAADAPIPDSAAAAAAFATGQKVNYEAVSVHPMTGEPITTVLEELRDAGYATGLVTTSRISHATPAAFAAHVASRYDEREIWEQMLETRPTLLFGGGTPGLTRARLTDAGYAVADDAAGLSALDPSAGAWAMIYGRDHLPYEFDGLGTAPSLSSMAMRAIELLSGHEPGFFLMIEGARIDHASHDNDFQRMVPEMLAFDDALTRVLEWADGRDDTLVLLTADHECGGLSIVHEESQGTLSRVEWSTGGHTSVPVSLYGWGPFAEVVDGIADNTEVHRLLRWPLAGAEAE